MRDQYQWAAPSPLWAEAAGTRDPAVRAAMRRPALLRFASDTFMDDFLAMLETDPSRLGGYLAEPETWRSPSAAPEAAEEVPRFLRGLNSLRLKAAGALEKTSSQALQKQLTSIAKPGAGGAPPLKLYQPAHQRFYLVAAHLVCRRAGLPDHALDANREERAAYVLRRLHQRAGAQVPEEYAFVTTAHGNAWQRIDDPGGALAPGEERLPLFPVNYRETDGRRRRLFAGMIPVGKRETYAGAAETSGARQSAAAPAGQTAKTARKIHFRMQVAEPWKALFVTADAALRLKAESPPPQGSDKAPDTSVLIKNSREQIQTMSWYILLDLSKYLALYLPNVWQVVTGAKKESDLANDAEKNLYETLKKTVASEELKKALTTDAADAPNRSASYKLTSVPTTLLDALRALNDPAKKWGEKLEAVAVSYDRKAPDAAWPDFLFPLADPIEAPPLPTADVGPPPSPADESGEAVGLDQTGVSPGVQEKQARVDKLVALVVRALPEQSGAPVPPAPLATQAPLDARGAQFVIRCVFERPLCGPLDPPVLSDPTPPFQLAGFFDPDAPARPIRIALPIDTTPGGLRKFDKNTAFMISDSLCGQMQRMNGITFGDLVLSVLPWPFHKDLSSKVPNVKPCNSGVDIGMICTFSIPIITICALILLMIIVLLFDFIFKWMPLFRICFPLPKFKAKA
ncbi:MAG TPA: hypothetical protein VF659_01960 [Pyrinomonadaceae bacterium]|jgi:hypothetical protein